MDPAPDAARTRSASDVFRGQIQRGASRREDSCQVDQGFGHLPGTFETDAKVGLESTIQVGRVDLPEDVPFKPLPPFPYRRAVAWPNLVEDKEAIHAAIEPSTAARATIGIRKWIEPEDSHLGRSPDAPDEEFRRPREGPCMGPEPLGLCPPLVLCIPILDDYRQRLGKEGNQEGGNREDE